ncbi:hypothetical protein [Vibrio sp. CAU 1672]|uniref:hypothetical protein n=1 Tax=Vibrio sp. CAU 1672 TaxID=3032594 RepID=UPI0023DC4DCE|nr:hypothetical protein [Vibrio sp. CAU 1672]MDF2153477.1 hypothetical protein [Vibrio sp. CAU 1672]
MKHSNSRNIAIASAMVFALAIAALKFENSLGLLPILIAIIAFFVCIIYTCLHLSGAPNSSVFDFYQGSPHSKALALKRGLNTRDRKP